jgi:four helix bundle protein
MTSLELQLRLKQFALRTVKVTESLPVGRLSKIIEDQLLRSAFSAAANYRAACKAISRKSFIAKLSIAFEESDESLFWLEVISEVALIPNEKMVLIIKESSELASILAASRKSAQARKKNDKATSQ